jgi:hypothetical protein
LDPVTRPGAGPQTSGLAELVDLINLHVGAWEHFGYADPPSPGCAVIPPLGERSASAIKAGHEAIADIDRLLAQLYGIREQLVGQLRRDEDIRMARPLPGAATPAEAAPCMRPEAHGFQPGGKSVQCDQAGHRHPRPRGGGRYQEQAQRAIDAQGTTTTPPPEEAPE